MIINDEVKKSLAAKDSFGELALIYNAPRSGTIQCKSDCKFWAIDRFTFRSALSEISQREFQQNRAFIERVPFFRNLFSFLFL